MTDEQLVNEYKKGWLAAKYIIPGHLTPLIAEFSPFTMGCNDYHSAEDKSMKSDEELLKDIKDAIERHNTR